MKPTPFAAVLCLASSSLMVHAAGLAPAEKHPSATKDGNPAPVKIEGWDATVKPAGESRFKTGEDGARFIITETAQVKIEGWGTTVDPAGDCKFKTEEDGARLTITVPAGSAKAHNLCAELANMDAPRVLRQVNGDFDLQVKVAGTFSPGNENGTGSRLPYQGAGLAVMADADNYVRMERAAMLYAGELRNYLNFEIRVDGELERFGSNEKFPLDETKPVWLRLERRGETMRGGMSQDGKEWSWGEPKKLTAKAWEKKSLKAGVHAISSSLAEFAPVYTDFTCGKPGKADDSKAKEKGTEKSGGDTEKPAEAEKSEQPNKSEANPGA